MAEKLEPAALTWEAGTVLRSVQFGDIYFSDSDGLAETTHVFLNGNDLAARFCALGSEPSEAVFTIGELGFGTGLNILAAWQAWQARGHDKGHLHLFSIEGIPLHTDDFAKAQTKITENWQELAPLCLQLQALYPPLVPGFHTLRLADDVTLVLAFGDVSTLLPAMTARTDAWFLDGFSPAANPAMWSEDVMREIARLSTDGATLATFTVAGIVRRGLVARGFSVEKRPGFGRKREMLSGRLEHPHPSPVGSASWYSTEHLTRSKGRNVTIIGAGIAGASLAWHLKRAGYDVTVYDKQGVASGASGNPAGLVLPRLDLGHTQAARFYLTAWLYTVSLIRDLERAVHEQILLSKGELRLSLTAEDMAKITGLEEENLLPEIYMEFVSTPAAAAISEQRLSVPEEARHMLIKDGGTVDPRRFVYALLQSIPIHQGTLLSYVPASTGAPVRVQIETPDGNISLNTDILMIATSSEANAFLEQPYLGASLGQLDVIDKAPPPRAITFGPYAAPAGQHTVIGATYENISVERLPETSSARTAENIAAIDAVLKGFARGTPLIRSRASTRCVTVDQHPVAGPLPDWEFFKTAYDGLKRGERHIYKPAEYQNGVYLLTGLGSRGLVTAPYCAHLVSALISGAPGPGPSDFTNLIHPARFFIRAVKRNAHF